MIPEKLFGTDGIRGRFGVGLLTPPLLSRLAHAVGLWIKNQGREGEVLLARDTRASGPFVEAVFVHKFKKLGISPRLLGILPTPALAHQVKNRGGYGVMISASHNPAHDNGIKLFTWGGEKLSESEERDIETLFSKIAPSPLSDFDTLQSFEWICGEAESFYTDFVLGTLPSGFSLAPLKIVLDCAHGAAFRVAPDVLKRLDAETIVVGASPDGLNINGGCGALHLDRLAEVVSQEKADVGIALDGDGDRLLLVDADGAPIDGDQILALLACAWQEEGRLPIPTIVSTVMANGALEVFLKGRGIGLERTPVGDRSIDAVLSKNHLPLGGEPSGHIILKEFSGSGDGLLVALQVLRIALERKKTLAEIFPLFAPFAQKLCNIPLPPFEKLSSPQTQDFLTKIQEKLEEEGGRLLVRPSGTELLLRLLVEGPSEAFVQKHLSLLLDFFHHESSHYAVL